MMGELYVLALFNAEGEFVEYVRKGRNNSITGYDNISSARRGLAQTNSNNWRINHQGYTAKIAIATSVVELKEVD